MENLYGKKIKLYDWQKEVNPAEDSFVIAPTGAGKSIAAYRWAFDDSDKKVIFTAPIKALSNERYLELKRIYKDKVGLETAP
ncbi:MAG: DEAD/DEAH box helicase [Hydrogenobacter sp.]